MNYILFLLFVFGLSFFFQMICKLAHRIHIRVEEAFVSSRFFDLSPKWFFNFLFHWFPYLDKSVS